MRILVKLGYSQFLVEGSSFDIGSVLEVCERLVPVTWDYVDGKSIYRPDPNTGVHVESFPKEAVWEPEAVPVASPEATTDDVV